MIGRLTSAGSAAPLDPPPGAAFISASVYLDALLCAGTITHSDNRRSLRAAGRQSS
ncbi:hypothetical protein EMEDMD4_530109 [Sinorhizobium medicae]|uniref:Uncharacterized protein n=1 Tax=Sinorhizobium medicae TaxID=110321 RepID=A0A508X224_9HYPH|nr:hypothetical protein EMEDMD4_530109 [Sinorhizobium medicae]